MLIVTKHTGQLCNQIWSLVPIIAYAEHTHSKVCVFNARKDYICLFPELRKYKRVWWIHLCNGEIGKFWRRISRLLEKHIRPLKDALECSNDAGARIVNGWEHHHDMSYINEQKRFLRKLFAPKKEVLGKVQNALSDFEGITIGIHIRRGDYKDWCGGAYYYTDEEYIHIMHSLAEEAKRMNRVIRFLICSNEPFNLQQTELPLFQISHTDGITDLYGVASCDYIVGPPSTYSQWASFYGDVPLCLILYPQQKIEFKDFSRIIALDRFENGKRMNVDKKTERFYLG